MWLESLANFFQTGSTTNNETTIISAASFTLYLLTATVVVLVGYGMHEQYPELPRLNAKKPSELTWNNRLLDYIANSRELLAQGSQQFPDKPYKLYTEMGDLLVVPPRYADELKSNKLLEFSKAAADDSHGYIPGFEPFVSEDGFVKVISNYLTKTLAGLTAPISKEAAASLRDIFTDYNGWTEISAHDVMLVVSRMSSRIFMGEELCNDKEWIESSSDYVSAVFKAGYSLNMYPRALRPVVHWFLPGFFDVRQKLKRSQAVLQPHIDRRMAIKAEAAARGEPHPYNDSIEWFSRELRPDHDPAAMQITLSLVAIHTTTDLLMQTMIDIAKHREIIGQLRAEVIRVLRTDGLKKTAFQKLKLMDSCFKESQRLRPVMINYFRRTALADVKLQDGFIIKKGTKVCIDGARVMLNEAEYPEPLRWDPHRFMRMREIPSDENKAYLVSTSTKHCGFGHGVHACPGRFFAANEVKIAMAHILLKYDWDLAEGHSDLKPLVVGGVYALPPGVKLRVRRRAEELDMTTLES